MIAQSQIATTQPPTDGQESTTSPAMISIAPTIIINTCGVTGSDDAMTGARGDERPMPMVEPVFNRTLLMQRKQ